MAKKKLASAGKLSKAKRYSYESWECLFLPGLKEEEERDEVLSTPESVSRHLLQSSLNAIRGAVGKTDKRRRAST